MLKTELTPLPTTLLGNCENEMFSLAFYRPFRTLRMLGKTLTKLLTASKHPHHISIARAWL